MSRMIPAFNFNGIIRPALTLDDDGNIILTDELNLFAATYGLKALYFGLDGSSPPKETQPVVTPPTTPSPMATPPVMASTDSMLPKGMQSVVTPPPVTSPPGNGSTLPAVTFFGITRPELFLDGAGNILLTPAALEFIALYGLKALYFGVPPFTPFPPVPFVPLSTPVDANSAANSVAEGAAANTPVGLTASSTSPGRLTVTFSLTADSSNGGFKIDSATGVVSVADPSKIDFESSGAAHAYSVTVRASDGIFSTTQTFTIGVSNVAPSTPTDANGSANVVAEGAAAGTLVGITATSADVNGGAVTYSLVADSSNGGFAVDAATGVVRVADGSRIDYESSAGHSYVITVRASDGLLSSTQTFTIGVTDVAPSTPVDTDAADNRIAEGAAVGTVVGITARSTDPNGPATVYALTADSSGGGFQIDPVTGVVSVANPAKIDFESSGASHSYSVTVQATVGAQVTTQTFTIGVTDVAPSAPTDSDNAANAVIEGAANGTVVGLTASSIELNGPGVIYSLTDDAGGRFAINSATGVVTVANGAAIDYETAPGHAYTIIVRASAGALSNSQSFSIGVVNVNEAPTGADRTVTALEDIGYVFRVADFGFSDPHDASAPNALRAVQIATLPAAGTLTNNNVVVNPGDFISVADIVSGHLVFTPAANDNGAGYASFTFRVQDDGGTANGGIDIAASANTITINVTAVNDAPTATGLTQSLTVAEDAATTTLFAVPPVISDIDSTNVTVTLTLPIEAGVLVNAGAATISDFDNVYTITGTIAQVNALLATVGYQAAHDFNGSFSVTIVVDDGHDGPQGTNPTGAVNVTVTSVNDAPVGADKTVTTAEDASYVLGVADFGFTDPADSSAPNALRAVQIVTLPGAGTLTNNNIVVNPGDFISVADILAGHLVFTPAANDNGAGYASFTFRVQDDGGTANGGVDIAASANTITINVTAVNDAPTATGLTQALTVAEDAAATALFATAPVISDIDSTNVTARLTLAIAAGVLLNAGAATVSGTDNVYTISGTQAAVNAALAAVTYQSALNFNGTASVGITVDDGQSGPQGSNPTGAVSITVTAVNDAPAGTDRTINAAGAYTFSLADFAVTDTADAAGAAGANMLLAVKITTLPATGALTNHGLAVSAGDFISATDIAGGFLVFTPALNTNASFTFQVEDNGGTANGGVDLDSTPNTFTINQNTPPVANADAASATERGGLNNATAGIDPTGNVITGAGGASADTDTETGTASLTVTGFGTGSSGPNTGIVDGTTLLVGAHGSLTLAADGTYHYYVDQTDLMVQALVAASAALTDTFHYTVTDPGGLSSTGVITVSIHGADDLAQAVADTGAMTEDAAATLFDVIANDTRDPDNTALNTIAILAGTTAVGNGTASAIGIDPTDVTLSVVANKIQVALTGSDFQKLAVGETATITIPYQLTGDTGQTTTANLVVTVNGVNDVPIAADDTPAAITEDQIGTFAVRANDTLDLDHTAPNSIAAGAVTNLVAPAGEGIVTGDIGVTVNASNQIVVTLGANFQHMHDGETATFDIPYTLQGDQPGDTSSATLHVTVNGVNDAPTASNVSFNTTFSANYNTDLVVNDPADGAPTTTGPFKGVSASLLSLSGASDIDGPNALTFTPLTNVATSDGGHVTLQADGDFIYTPRVGTTATTDTFSFTVTDGNAGVTGPGTVTRTATITLQGPHIWYVDSSAAAGGDGSSERPFNSLAPLNGVGNDGATAGDVDGAGDIIYLENGTYSSGITLEANQQLISRSHGLVVSDGGAGTVTLDSASGSNALINGAVVLNTGNNIQGVNFGNTGSSSVFALSGTSVGDATINNLTAGSINNTGGGAVNINGSTAGMNLQFSSVSSAAGATGISLTNALGTFNAAGGTLSGHTTSEISISGGTGTITYGGTIGDGAGLSASIVNRTGGTVTLSGNITDGADTGGGIGISGNANTTINFTGTTKTLNTGTGDAVSMTNNTGTSNVNFTNGGLDIDTTNGTGFQATVAGTYTVTGTGNTITTTGTGTALNLNTVTVGGGAITFDSASTSNAANGILIDTVSGGAITINGGAIAGASNRGVDINAAQNNISIASSVTSTAAGRSVEVTNSGKAGGNTISFSGAITDPGFGINLDNNDQNGGVATVNFSGGLNIDSTTHTGFNATNGGTVNVTGSNNSIATTTGTALNVTNTTIGASNITLKDVSSNGAVNGIVLNNTGTSGHLAVTGTGTTAGTGGTIQNSTGDGVSLTDTQDVSLANMTISDNSGSGINGLRVNGAVLTKLTLNSNADAVGESGILFNELTGNASHVTTFSNLTVSNSYQHNVQVINSGGTLANLVVTGSTFSNDGSSNNAGSDFIFEADPAGVAGLPTMTITADGNTFTGNNAYGGPGVIPGTGLFIVANDGTVNAHIGETTANTFNNLNNAINLTQSANNANGTGGNLNFTVKNNVITNSDTTAINVFSSGDLARTLDGIIQNNVIGIQNVATSGSRVGNGIRIGHEALGVAKVLIDGNTVQSIGVANVSGGDSIAITQLVQPGTVHATVTNNIIRDNAASRGITISATLSGAVINADVHGNTITNVNNANAIRFSADGLGGADGTINVPQASSAAISSANGGATVLTDARTFFNQPAPLLPATTPQFAARGQGPGGMPDLTAAMLAPIVSEAIAHWAAAGATAEQIALLNSTHVTITDLSNGILGNTNAHGIEIDADGAGWGWFVDATPGDNSEYSATSSPTELVATSGAAAAHIDLLTLVEHELGHVIGLADSGDAGVMHLALDTGERRLPDAGDVVKAVEAQLPASAQAASGTPIVVGTSGDDVIDAGQVDQTHAGRILLGGGGADTFVFGSNAQPGAQVRLTHVADYSAAQGDRFDFSALTQTLVGPGSDAAMVVRAVEDSSGAFATLQINTNAAAPKTSAPTSSATWASVAQLDGAHAGDAVDVVIGVGTTAHLAHIHVDLLA